jgi:hypothetical protein
MRRAVIISAAVHVVVLAFVLIGMPHLFRATPPEPQAIAVEMVTPDKAPAPKPEPKPEPPKVETAPPQPPPLPEPKPQRVETPPPPPPPPPMPEPKPRVVEAPPPPPAPQPPAPKPATPEVATVTPDKIPAPAPAPTPRPKPAPPQPEAKPTPPAPPAKPRPQQQAQQQDPFETMLKNLEKQKQQAEQAQVQTPQRPQPPSPPPPQVASPGPPRPAVSSIDQRRAASELGKMIQDQVTPCWNIPIGTKGIRDLQVPVSIDLNPDGTLRGNPTIADMARYNADPAFQALADSALRALRNPRCSPLKLPYDQYELWKHINLTFTPPEGV